MWWGRAELQRWGGKGGAGPPKDSFKEPRRPPPDQALEGAGWAVNRDPPTPPGPPSLSPGVPGRRGAGVWGTPGWCRALPGPPTTTRGEAPRFLPLPVPRRGCVAKRDGARPGSKRRRRLRPSGTSPPFPPECPAEARMSRTREPRAAALAAPPAHLFTLQPYLRAIGPGIRPRGAQGRCGFCFYNWGRGLAAPRTFPCQHPVPASRRDRPRSGSAS